MKKVSFLLITLALVCCSAGNRQTASREDLSFSFGNRLPSPPFTGEAYLNSLIRTDTVFNFPATNSITFAPGAHSTWHRHGGMVVMVTGGVGYYQEDGKPAQILRKGDILEIPAGVRHWHGATPDNWFSQIVIYDSAWQPDAREEEDNTLSDADYKNVTAVEYAHTPGLDEMMFPAPEQAITLPTFNGPVHLGNTLEASNVAGCPSIHNVIFEPGVYNAWHSHAGGQVLIVTDGIGYHQIEGQPVEVLHPGDVALCPPGVKHWHGAAPGSRFAHLAANANPDKPGVEWFDLLPEEEYNKLPKE